MAVTIRNRLGRLRRYLRHLGPAHYCPCCRSWIRQFRPHGNPVRPHAACPRCGALERHRLMVRYFRKRTDLFDGRPKRMLHVAPERGLAGMFEQALGRSYVSVDLGAHYHPRLLGDVTALSFPDATFDVIYCSHVLEHVPDDLGAMRELRRVLKPDGWAILQVPMRRTDHTYEDWTKTTPEQRLAAFGQRDHVREYGPDYVDRLRRAGFLVTVEPYGRAQAALTRWRCGLSLGHDVYVCRHPA